MRKILVLAAAMFAAVLGAYAQTDSTRQGFKGSENEEETGWMHYYDQLSKQMDDVLWYEKVGDVAYIDKVYLYGEPPAKQGSPTSRGYGNPLKFWNYIFIPKNIDVHKKYPLIVFPHSGVHADMTTYYAHIVRELIAQGYVIVSTEYRGSTGYGEAFYKKIDYGGRENSDVKVGRDYMIENYSFIDSTRVGIMGWSHGGMITLMNLFEYPTAYKCGFAGVPVSDLLIRMGIADDDYRALFSAPYHLGVTVEQNVAEYKKRSPAWNASKLQTPLLIHTNTADDDVDVSEVQHLIQALKADGKTFEYKIFDNAPGGHSFDRLDTRGANEIRLSIYQFMARYLSPAHPFKSVDDLREAAYRFN